MSIESWRDGYQRGFIDGLQVRDKLDDERENKLMKSRLKRLAEMREEWESDENIGYVADNWDYRKPFDEVVFPDKCQECEGDCKVC